MNKYLRNLVLNKVAATYEDPEHQERIRKRRKVLMGEEDEEGEDLPLTPTEEDKIEEFLRKKKKQERETFRSSKKDPRAAVVPEHVEEISLPYNEVLRQRGINPDREPLSTSEKERRRQIENELNLFSTIGEVEGPEGLQRHYVDPNHPQISRMHKYFGYYDKEKDEWHPTQFSYILYYMSVYAPEFELTDYWDRAKIITPPDNHPYYDKYRKPKEFFPFKLEMEDRILKDFPNLARALSKSVWQTNFRSEEGLTYITPIAPEGDRRFSDSVQFRFLPEENSFTVKGPKAAIRVPSTYVAEESDMARVTSKILSRSELYPKLSNAINILTKEINDKILGEVLLGNRELNFRRRTPEEKEMVRGAIINAINKILSGEVTKIVQEHDMHPVEPKNIK